MYEKNIICGREPAISLPEENVGKIILQSLFTRDRNDTAFINAKTGENLKYGQLLDDSCRLAQSLKTYGVTSDKIIAIASDNHINNFTVVLAALYMAIPITFMNPKLTEYELQHALDVVKPEIVFCSTPYAKKFDNLKSNNSFVKEIIVIDDGLSKFINKYSITSQDSSNFKTVDVDITNHIAFILFSSGTTGLPKGVMLSHLNVMADLIYALDCWTIPDDNGVSLFVLPFFHTYGLHGILVALLRGRKIIILEKFEPNTYLSAIEKYRISTLATVPPLIQFLLKDNLVNRYDLSSVKNISCGAAPLSKELEEAIKKKLNIPGIGQGFGMTELGLAINTPVGKERHGSVGVVVTGICCVIKDVETGENLGPHRRGELCVKGPTVMQGYYRNEEATREAFTNDGWMKTGDIAYYDDDGYFYVVDRIKELIKYKGFQIAPAELEQILLTNNKIQDVGVIGLPDDNAGELPMAFVVKQPGINLTEVEVQQYLARFVSRNKYLSGGVKFIDEIPRNPSGKILRKELKKLLTKRQSKL